MNNAAERPNRKTEAHKQLLILLLIFLAVVFVGVLSFLKFYGDYIDGVIYAERLSQMREVTTQLFTGIDDVVQNQWGIAETQSRYFQEYESATADELIAFMERQARLNTFDFSQSEMMAADDTGRYYTQNGIQGTLTGLNYLMDEPERVSYVYNAMTTNKSEMVFLLKLPEPVTMRVGEQTVRLKPYA